MLPWEIQHVKSEVMDSVLLGLHDAFGAAALAQLRHRWKIPIDCLSNRLDELLKTQERKAAAAASNSDPAHGSDDIARDVSDADAHFISNMVSDSYSVLYCRRCWKYDCKIHGIEQPGAYRRCDVPIKTSRRLKVDDQGKEQKRAKWDSSQWEIIAKTHEAMGNDKVETAAALACALDTPKSDLMYAIDVLSKRSESASMLFRLKSDSAYIFKGATCDVESRVCSL